MNRKAAPVGEPRVPNEIPVWQIMGGLHYWFPGHTGVCFRVTRPWNGPGFVVQYGETGKVRWNSANHWRTLENENGSQRVFPRQVSAKRACAAIDSFCRGTISRYTTGGANFRDWNTHPVIDEIDPRKDYSK